MYEAVEDPNWYPGTTVLKNKLDLREQADLDAFEAEITAQRATEPLPDGDLGYAHYRAIHHHLFQDVFDWAGTVRTIRIGKGGNWFCYPEHIDAQMERLFDDLKRDDFFRNLSAGDYAVKAAHLLAELNAIHPFREGNGRTQLSFLALLSEKAGHPLDLDRLEPARVLNATIESFSGNENELASVIAELI